ncbi:hypothetical protein E4U19_007111 [Claviceps sp. Clav32 group G5]|nr:hypothetical protein E4U19_007111 [Claviceps sp. Clav32 group G5]
MKTLDHVAEDAPTAAVNVQIEPSSRASDHDLRQRLHVFRRGGDVVKLILRAMLCLTNMARSEKFIRILLKFLGIRRYFLFQPVQSALLAVTICQH